MGTVERLKTALTGRAAAADPVATLTARIAANRARVVEAEAAIVALEAESERAANWEAAQAALEKLARLRWDIRAADRELPELQAELVTVKGARQHAAIIRHQAVLKALYPRLRAALKEAAAVQQEAFAARHAAETEIGGNAAALYLPHLAYRGLLVDEFIDLWAAENDRMVAAMRAPSVARPHQVAPVAQRALPAPGGGAIGGGDAVRAEQIRQQRAKAAETQKALDAKRRAEPAKPAPAPALHAPPSRPSQPAAGDIEMMVVRGGYCTPDGVQRARGEIVWVEPRTASAAVANGALEFVSATAAVAATPAAATQEAAE